MGKSRPLEYAKLANQIQGFRIADRSDSWENNKSAYFPPCWPFLMDLCFTIFKNSQMIYAGFVNVATEKSQAGLVKLRLSSSAREVKFSQGEGKNAPGWVSLGLLGRHQTITVIALVITRVLSYVSLCKVVYPFNINSISSLGYVTRKTREICVRTFAFSCSLSFVAMRRMSTLWNN